MKTIFSKFANTLFVAFLMSTLSFAQNLGSRDASQNLNSNTEIEIARQVLLNTPAPRDISVDLMSVIHSSFRDSKEQELLPIFESLEPHTLNAHPELIFLMGMAQHSNYEFQKAIISFKKCKELLNQSLLSNISTSEVIYELVLALNKNWVDAEGNILDMDKVLEKKITECYNAISLNAKPQDVKITNPGSAINSEYADFGPVFRKGDSTLFFTSRRPQSIGNNTYNTYGEYYEDIYIATRHDGSWRDPENIGRPINGRSHEAVVGMSHSGDTMFVFSGRFGGDILFSTLKDDGDYGRPERFSYAINSEQTERSLTISPDQKFVVYQREDDSNGFGGGDLYLSQKLKNGEWSESFNLGKTINTEFDEDGIYLAEDGKTLYFSSKGHNSMGGYDIFYTTLKDGKWSSPRNMGAPINSPKDDIYFSMNHSKNFGYFSSNRQSTLGSMDIFKADFNVAPKKTYVALSGRVVNSTSNIPITATIRIENTNDSDHQLIENAAIEGNYFAHLEAGKDYRIEVKADGFENYYRTLSIPKEEQENTMSMDIMLVPFSKTDFNHGLFAYDKSELTESHKNELDAIANEMYRNKSLLLRIEGHADHNGSKSYNLELSKKRAQRAYDYLVDKGLSTDRLSWVAFGEQHPVAPNELEGKDNPDGRQLNRRNEFVITWRTQTEEVAISD